jgi:hypothetical protein
MPIAKLNEIRCNSKEVFCTITIAHVYAFSLALSRGMAKI